MGYVNGTYFTPRLFPVPYTSMSAFYRLNVRLYPDRYRQHREIVDFLMRAQGDKERNMIGRHVEAALVAYIRAEREALRQASQWPDSGGGPARPGRRSRKAHSEWDEDIDPALSQDPALSAEPAHVPPRRAPTETSPAVMGETTNPPKSQATPRTTSTEDRFGSLVQKLHAQFNPNDKKAVK